MIPILQNATGNLLLERMAPADFGRLAPHLVAMDLPARTVVQMPGKLEHYHFLRSGLASVIAVGRQQEQADIGQVGNEGVLGRSRSHSITNVNIRVEMTIAGNSWAVPIDTLRIAMDESPSLKQLVEHFYYTFHLQMVLTLLTTARFSIPQRLARLLLMCQDRVGNEFPITHGQLAQILSVRRAGITEALQILEGSQMLKSLRGSVRILDRPRLIDLADGSYGGPEAAYDQILPPSGADRPAMAQRNPLVSDP